MKNTYPVLVTTKTGHRTWHWFTLVRRGFVYIGNGRYEGSLSKRGFKKLSALCKKKHLKCVINNSYGVRGSNYRRDFFALHPPTIFSGYFCSYCGLYVPKKKVSVDHLYPIGKASISFALQKWLKFIGIDDINSPQNLVPSCRRCNQRKGSKMGLWIIKGYFGRLQRFWYLRWVVRISIIAVILATLIRMLG